MNTDYYSVSVDATADKVCKNIKGEIPICNCQYHNKEEVMHITTETNGECDNCGHYVFWGTTRDITQATPSKSGRARKSKFSESAIKSMSLDLKSGLSVNDICDKYEVGKTFVYKIRKEVLGSKYKQNLINKVRDKILSGSTQKAASEEFGVSQSTIKKWKSNGWKE